VTYDEITQITILTDPPYKGVTMKKLVMTGLALLVVTLTAAPARAWHGCCPPPPPCCVTWCEQTVTCYKPEYDTRDVACTVMKPIYHTDVVKQKCVVMVPVWSDQKQSCMVPTYKPKEIEQDVVRCRLVPVKFTDPCTGCVYTCCKPETYTEKVKCTIMECHWVKKEYTVKVCSWKPEEKTYDVRRVWCEWKPEKVTYKQVYCVMVPYQAKVWVPVCCH
jgi:hypothetical protein